MNEPRNVARRCARCGVHKPVDEFGIKNRGRGTRRSYCRPCAAEVSHAHYERNRAAYAARARARKSIERVRVRTLVADYLDSHPCIDCGEADPVVLDFDHRDPASKSGAIGRLIQSRSWRSVLREIEKCDVRCANCHRLRTAQQFGWSTRLQ